MKRKITNLGLLLAVLASPGSAKTFEERWAAGKAPVRATIYVKICETALCKIIHGEESAIVPSTEFDSVEECEATTALATKWIIGDSYPYRIECK